MAGPRPHAAAARPDTPANEQNREVYCDAYAPPRPTSTTWVPRSRIRPSRMYRMQSALRIVERRCATTKLVLPSMSSSNAAWTCSSVRVSMLEVASSNSRIAGSVSITRAMQSSCFWPAENDPPSSPITVSYPSGSAAMNASACARRAASTTCSRVASGRP